MIDAKSNEQAAPALSDRSEFKRIANYGRGGARQGVSGWALGCWELSAGPWRYRHWLGSESVWIDGHFPSRYSWTLMLLIIGVLAGCLNAWHWVAAEEREIRKEKENPNEREQHDNKHS